MPPVPPSAAAAIDALPGRLVAAVSGGCDSIALLHLLVACGRRPTVVHVRHGLRSDADDAGDASFVEQVAASLGLPCRVVAVAVDRDQASLEDAARQARYAALAREAARDGSLEDKPASDGAAVVTGHTRDDQVETVLFRIARGCGLDGLAGMANDVTLRFGDAPPCRVCRPLLAVSRAKLQQWAEAAGLTWRNDPTNASVRFARNRIRREVLPAMRAINPQADAALARLAETAASTAGFVRRVAESRLDDWLAEADVSGDPLHGQAAIALPRRFAWLDAAPTEERIAVLRAVWRRLGWPERAMTAAHWRRLAESTQPASDERDANGGVRPRQFDLPGVRVRITGGAVSLTRRD